MNYFLIQSLYKPLKWPLEFFSPQSYTICGPHYLLSHSKGWFGSSLIWLGTRHNGKYFLLGLEINGYTVEHIIIIIINFDIYSFALPHNILMLHKYISLKLKHGS